MQWQSKLETQHEIWKFNKSGDLKKREIEETFVLLAFSSLFALNIKNIYLFIEHYNLLAVYLKAKWS